MTTPIGSTRPVYAPYLANSDGPQVGLAPLPPRAWIEVDHELAQGTARKQRLLATVPANVFQSIECTLDAQAETRELLAAYLPARYPGLYKTTGDVFQTVWNRQGYHLTDESNTPLAMASCWVQEDLCLLRETNEGFCLTAGCVCSPTFWNLKEKLGLPLHAIHRPVPGYAEKIGTRVDRLFRALRVDRPVWRTNWNISDSPEAFQPHSQCNPTDVVNAAQVAERLFLRVERQTLRRLPRCGDILFTIRVYIDPISVLKGKPVLAKGLKKSITSLNDDQLTYKRLSSIKKPVLDYLDGICTQA